MSEKVYLFILKTGIYASLLSVFLVFKNLLFPYITSKQISFNILIEILFVLWVAFIVKFPSYRPKRSYISFGLLAFFAVLIVSSIAGVDFNLSFWGDVERMLGVFHLLHFLAFYFIVITVMRNWLDWKIFFVVSTVFAFIVSLIGLGQASEFYSTIGNTAYVSGYLIFNLYFCVLLFSKESSRMLRWVYLLPIPVYLLEFNKADTTGAVVGLGSSIIVMFFLYGMLVRNKKIKLATLAISILALVSSFLIITNRNSDFVRSNPLLSPIAEVDFNKATFQTRLISWRAAFKDFKNHPFLGTGFGNYAIIFDKYFDPKFYNYTSSETYFDRAHNNVIDIASTSGLLGILAYLSIFVAIAYYLIKGYRKEYFSIHDFVLIASLIVAYFVQNLAVFDSLVTYVGLMMTLGFVYWIYREGEKSVPQEAKEKGEEIARRVMGQEELANREIYALLSVGAVVLIIMWQFNIMPYNMLVQTIEGQKAWAQGDPKSTIEIYKNALSHNTVLDRDSRTSLIRLFADPSAFQAFPEKDRMAVADYLIDLAEKNVNYNKEDSLSQLMLSQLLDAVSKIPGLSQDKFAYYSNRALDAVNEAIQASPGRPPVYYQKAQIQLSRGEQDQALATLKEAYDLNPDYKDSSCHLGKTILYLKKNEKDAYPYIDKCIDLGGANLLAPAGQIQMFIAHYSKLKDDAKVIKLYEALVNANPSDTKSMIELAKLYAKTGRKDQAIAIAQKVSEKDPSVSSYVSDFIKSLK